MSLSLELCPHLRIINSSLRLVQFFEENDILIDIGSYLRVDLLLIQLFGNVLDRFVLRENVYLTRICCDLSHLEPSRVHWNCVYIYGLFKLTSSSILRGERYSNRDWFLFTCGFVARSVVWERFGSLRSWGEHWLTRTNFVLFDTASRLLLCENCFTCTTFEICVGRL